MSISKTKENLSKTCHLGIRLVAFVCVLGLNSLSVQANSDILGAGATFPQPIIDTWLKAFQKQQILTAEYEALGSAEGIRRITSRSVDFGVTDIALTQSELAHDDLFQFPLVASGIAPVINLPGVDVQALKLSGPLLARIMMGHVIVWDDPEIKALNPNLELPSIPISVIHRQEGSGTTFSFTHYLSQISAEWDARFGIGSQVMWPIGLSVKGNLGMAQQVKLLPGSIGYIEFMYAKQNQLGTPSLGNSEGQYLQPSLQSFTQATNQARWTRPSFYQSLTNMPGAGSWPIMGVSYVLLHKLQNDSKDAAETLKLLNWIYTNGSGLAKSQDYILIDDITVLTRIRSGWGQMRDTKGQLIQKP
jgi:phosphate transport system substrate-binding protein